LVGNAVLYMSMSVDGFIAGPNEGPGNGLGDGGHRLHDWLTGGDHHDGVPIWVLSRREPGIDVSQWPLVTYVNDVGTAMAQAKRAAGDKNVLVHGAATAQLALAAGVLDELEIHLIPVILGGGRRLFENLGPEHIELECTRVLEGEAGATHMHYRVQG
jgi:dihydrofolate reductase